MKDRFGKREVLLTVTYAGHTPKHPAHFLNEARLTAVALSICLAAAKLNRPSRSAGTTLRLLVLDDVLIGLDIAHRLPLLKLLTTHFTDWQIFMFTNDMTWFEMAWQQIDKNRWVVYELACVRRNKEPFERPLLKQGGADGFLIRARQHLAAGEKRAATVYARAAFEAKLRKFCSDKSIHIPFKTNQSQIDGDTFLSAIEKRIRSQKQWGLVGEHIHRLKMLRKVILNPLSHSNLVHLVTPEYERSRVQARTRTRPSP